MESRRCFTMLATTCRSSAGSSPRPFSTSFMVSADFSMRSVPSVIWSRAFIASVIALLTTSIRATGVSMPGGRAVSHADQNRGVPMMRSQ